MATWWDGFRWATSIALLSLGGFAICGNYILMLRAWFTPGSNYSLLPLVGGCAGFCGALLCPSKVVSDLYWLPLLIDPGCGLLLVGFAWFLCHHRRGGAT